MEGREKIRPIPLQEALDKFARIGGTDDHAGDSSSTVETTTSLVQLGCGLPAISKKLLEKIEADEYIDFSELPPAKGKDKTAAQSFEGQIVVVQACSRPHSVSQADPRPGDVASMLQVGDRSHRSAQAREGGRSNGLHGHHCKGQSNIGGPPGSFMISISGWKQLVIPLNHGPLAVFCGPGKGN